MIAFCFSLMRTLMGVCLVPWRINSFAGGHIGKGLPGTRQRVWGTRAGKKGAELSRPCLNHTAHSVQIGVAGRGVIRVMWHLRINQILLGCSDGTAKVLFDPQRSIKYAFRAAQGFLIRFGALTVWSAAPGVRRCVPRADHAKRTRWT